MKTLQQIREQVAKEYSFLNYSDLIFSLRQDCEHDKVIDEVALRYALQFKSNTDIITSEMFAMQERIAYLEELLEGIAKEIELGESIGKINLLTSNSVEYDSIKRLINKGK